MLTHLDILYVLKECKLYQIDIVYLVGTLLYNDYRTLEDQMSQLFQTTLNEILSQLDLYEIVDYPTIVKYLTDNQKRFSDEKLLDTIWRFKKHILVY